MTRLVRYSLDLYRPEAHLLRVTLTVAADGEALRFALPAWIPGSYLIRDFARNLVRIEARAGQRAVKLTKLDKHTWAAPAVRGEITLEYEVYAWDLSVRAAHFDRTHAFFNGTSVFLRVLGREDWPCQVDLRASTDPELSDWRVATALPSARGAQGAKRYGFGLYEACDYDELIDHPVEMGHFALGHFEAGGARHDVAVTGEVPNLDMPRLCRDLAQVCEAQVRLFEPRQAQAPVDRYVFLVTAVGDGYGGLEHRASTALLCSRRDLPTRTMGDASEAYRGFLGLASHEYFHTWNVKRIKPAAFVPYPLDRECTTELLWIFEGFTSYYDDLMLVRSGLLTHAQYLQGLAKTITDVLRAPSRLRQSVAQSSFDAWTKYYRPDENTPNAVVSYYAKGALVAFCLDLQIRRATRGKHSLDDVMRHLWRTLGRDFYRGRAQGLAEDAFAQAVVAATGVDLQQAIADFAYSTKPLPLEEALEFAGCSLTAAPESEAPDLGLKTKTVDGGLVVATAYDDGAAMRAGISAGDTLVAIEQLRVDARNLQESLGRYRVGDTVRVHAFRRDELKEFSVRLAAAPAKYTIAPKSAARAQSARRQWLGKERAPSRK